MERSLPLPLAAAIGAALLAAVLLLGPAPAAAKAASCGGAKQPAYTISAKAAAKATLCVLNKARARRGLKPLHSDRRQRKAANNHNRVMLAKNCFSHLCPGERDLIGRFVSTGYLPCSCTWGVGENLAWGAGTSAAPAAVVKAWMASPGHRANILNGRFDEIGIAVDKGSPNGDRRASTYTADFGFKN